MNKLMFLILLFLLSGIGVGCAADEAVVSAVPGWIDSNFWSMASGVFVLLYEFLVLKLPTNKTLSLIGNLYKLLTNLIPDRSANGGKFTIKE